MTAALALEQLRIRVFGYFKKWLRARLAPDARAFFASMPPRHAASSLAVRWDQSMPLADIRHAIEWSKREPPPRPFMLPPGYVMTPIGPIPEDIRDRLVLKLRCSLDDRNDWMQAVRS